MRLYTANDHDIMWCVRLFLAMILLYLAWSCLEYVVHRYLMHTTRDIPFAMRHRLHHSATRLDMSLNKQQSGYVTLGKEENLCMSGWETVAMYAAGLVLVVPCVILVGAPIRSSITLCTVVFALCLALYTNITWNTIHPLVHGESPAKCGNFVLKHPAVIRNPLFAWLQENHRAHHHFKGAEKGNYNVTLPGADFLFGTYRVRPTR